MLERLFTMIVFPVSQSGLFRLLDESRQLISSISLSLSLLPAATGPVVIAQGCWTDYCDYLSLSLSHSLSLSLSISLSLDWK